MLKAYYILANTFVLTFCICWPFPANALSVLQPVKASLFLLEKQESFDQIKDKLDDGPLVVQSPALVPTEKTISVSEAIKTSSSYCGGENAVIDASQLVIFSDREFPGRILKDRLCWLLKFKDILDIPTPKGPRSFTLYVVIDAKSGLFWEAFTEPSKSWWNRVTLKNESYAKDFSQYFGSTSIANSRPKLTLKTTLLRRSQEKMFLPSVASCEQIIFRYCQFTDPNSGVGVIRADGSYIIPFVVDRQVWLISVEGINIQGPVEAPIPGHKPSLTPNQEEFVQVLDAQTDEELGLFSSR